MNAQSQQSFRIGAELQLDPPAIFTELQYSGPERMVREGCRVGGQNPRIQIPEETRGRASQLYHPAPCISLQTGPRQRRNRSA